MPLRTVRWSLAGRPVRDFCAGSRGRSRSHNVSVSSLVSMRRRVGRRRVCGQALVDAGNLRLVTGFKVARLTETEDGVLVAGDDEVLGPFDRIVATIGFRPDLSLLSEVRLDLDPAVESPRALAPLIDPNVHSCGSVPPHGAQELKHPDANLFVIGMKSYGRAPTFLLLTGYEQARSVVSAIA